MIKTIAFDLGGVIITIDQEQAISRFKEIGALEVENGWTLIHRPASSVTWNTDS